MKWRRKEAGLVELKEISKPFKCVDILMPMHLNGLSLNVYSIKAEGGWVNPLIISKRWYKNVILLLLIIQFKTKKVE